MNHLTQIVDKKKDTGASSTCACYQCYSMQLISLAFTIQIISQTISAMIPMITKKIPPSVDKQPLFMNKHTANKKIKSGGQASTPAPIIDSKISKIISSGKRSISFIWAIWYRCRHEAWHYLRRRAKCIVLRYSWCFRWFVAHCPSSLKNLRRSSA